MTILGLAACAVESTPRADTNGGEADATRSESSFQGRIYDRDVVFMASDSAARLAVPLHFQAHTQPGAVERVMRGSLLRDGTWDPFLEATWETPPSRVPWRLLPHGPFRIIVGDDDAMDRFIYSEGPRFLELGFGNTLVDWSGPRGETFRLQEASLLFSDQETTGVLLDMARARKAEDPPPGDWAFLASGDSLHMILEDAAAPDPDLERPDSVTHRAWARVDFRDTQWPEVTVTWTVTRSFEPARRQVPVRWLVTSGDGELEGEISVETTHLEAGGGEGPILPLSGFYEVTGRMRLQGAEYPVRGLIRHVQR